MAKKKKNGPGGARIRFTEEEKTAILDAFAASGQSASNFAASDGRVTAQTMQRWLVTREAGETTALTKVESNARYGKRGRSRMTVYSPDKEPVSAYPAALVAGDGDDPDSLEGSEVLRLRKVNAQLVKALKQAQAQVLELAELA